MLNGWFVFIRFHHAVRASTCRKSLLIYRQELAVLFVHRRLRTTTQSKTSELNMSDKQELSQTENGPIAGSKKRTCARHCKRFWWIYLIVLCCIVVLVVPLM